MQLMQLVWDSTQVSQGSVQARHWEEVLPESVNPDAQFVQVWKVSQLVQEDGHARQVESEDKKYPVLHETHKVESVKSHCLQLSAVWQIYYDYFLRN